MPNMSPQTIRLDQGDDIVLQYLGAAVVLQWHNLPDSIQEALRQQAESIGGLPMSIALRKKTTSLIERSRTCA